jgi:PAS domain S-box-containing protein
MFRQPPLPMPIATGLLVGLVCLALIGIEGWWDWTARTAQLESAQTESVNLVERVAQHAAAVFDLADDMLLGVAERMQGDGTAPAVLQRLDRLLALRAATFPQLYEVNVVGPGGARLATSLAERSSFPDSQLEAIVAYHRAHDDSSLYVGPLRQSRRDGRWVVSLSRRFNAPDGSFAGAVEVVIDLNYFQDFYRRLGLGPHSTVSLWRDDGVLLVRQPPVPDALSEAVRSIDLSRLQAFRAQSGMFTMSGKIDGEPRIYAYQHLERVPLILFYGVAVRDALAGWQTRTLTHIGLLALFLCVVALMGSRILRQVRRTRKAEGAYRLLADHSTDVVFTLDRQCRLEFITPSALERIGVPPERLIGTEILQYVHPEDREAAEAAYRAVAAGQDRGVVQYRLRHADGHFLWVEIELKLVRSPVTGAPMSIIGASRDVTAKRMAEITLQAEQAFFQAVFEYTTDALFVQSVQADGSFPAERINAAAARSLAIAAQDAVGQSPRSLFGEQYGAALEDGLRDTLAAKRAMPMDDRVADGVTWEVILVPLPGVSGQIERILITARDVSEQRRVQEAGLLLRAGEEQRRLAAEATSERLDRLARHLGRARDQAELANQAKSRFLTNMSHELRTPLNGILGYAQLLRMEGGLSPSQIERVEAMREAGRHLLEMITGVLDIAQIEADKITLQNADVSLPELVQACMSLVRPVAESKGLTLGFVMAPDGPAHLQVDPTRLRQVLLNLLGNAVKFTAAGAVEVRLLWNATQTTMRMEVADTGPGIPPVQRERLFEAFERMDDPSGPSTEGTGLGLMISARLIGAMGGRIGCDAGADGAGSVFWFELPAVKAEAAEAAPSEAGAVPVTPLRLLVVDDIANNRDIAAAFLRSAGHRVTSAASGAAAVRAAAAKRFDAVLMDVRMPGMDGLEATRQIRALPPPNGAVPIIAVTAQAFPEQIEACHQAGMDHHLSKPFEVEALLNAVATGIGGAERARDAAPAPPSQETAPILDHAIFAATASYLPQAELAVHMQALVTRGQGLLAALQGDQPAEEAAALAHAMAGAAGTFGFQQIADVGRRYEYAVETRASERDMLGEALIQTTIATIAALQDMAASALVNA